MPGAPFVQISHRVWIYDDLVAVGLLVALTHETAEAHFHHL